MTAGSMTEVVTDVRFRYRGILHRGRLLVKSGDSNGVTTTEYAVYPLNASSTFLGFDSGVKNHDETINY